MVPLNPGRQASGAVQLVPPANAGQALRGKLIKVNDIIEVQITVDILLQS